MLKRKNTRFGDPYICECQSISVEIEIEMDTKQKYRGF